MSWDEQEDTREYKVVVNHEEQYSIWLADREIPLGWRELGKAGTKQECLDYIEEVWTDMRPLSLRKKMEEFLSDIFLGTEVLKIATLRLEEAKSGLSLVVRVAKMFLEDTAHVRMSGGLAELRRQLTEVAQQDPPAGDSE